MSNWTHVNCCIRGDFDREKIVELFGEPTIEWCRQNKYECYNNNSKYKKIEKKIIASHEQSKLPCGEEPLHWELYKPDQTPIHKNSNFEVYSCDQDVLTITGDLRWFDMDENGIKIIEKICTDILDAYDYGIRQLIMQVYESYSGKTWIWESTFGSKLKKFEFAEEFEED